MSKINGDKARVNRKRKSRQKMRERVRVLKNEIGTKPAGKSAAKRTG